MAFSFVTLRGVDAGIVKDGFQQAPVYVLAEQLGFALNRMLKRCTDRQRAPFVLPDIDAGFLSSE